jgi:hypothetical protein
MDSASSARAFMTVDVEQRDPDTGQPALDTREASVIMAKRDGDWVITTAEPGATAQAPGSP